MRDKTLQIRADDDFLAKVDYLRRVNGWKSTSETVRKIIEKEYRKESGGGSSQAPTDRQVEYAKYLAERMCKELPKEFTKQAYSDFISLVKPMVKAEDDAMNEPDEWQLKYT